MGKKLVFKLKRWEYVILSNLQWKVSRIERGVRASVQIVVAGTRHDKIIHAQAEQPHSTNLILSPKINLF